MTCASRSMSLRSRRRGGQGSGKGIASTSRSSDASPTSPRPAATPLPCSAAGTSCCPGHSVTLDILAGPEQLPRRVTLLAEPEPSNPFERFVVALDQIAGILVVVGGGVAGVDAAGRHELGLLPLRDVVQPRPGLWLLRSVAAMAAASARAEWLGVPLPRLRASCGPDPVRPARPRRISRIEMALAGLDASCRRSASSFALGVDEAGGRFVRPPRRDRHAVRHLHPGIVVAVCAVAILLVVATPVAVRRTISACVG